MSRAIEAKPLALTGDSRDVRWPAERFLWAVVDAPGMRSPGPVAPGLLPQLAEQVHVEPDALAAVAAPLGGGRALVCAVERSSLAAVGTKVLRLTPAELPGCVAAEEGMVRPEALDLLVGEHLPASVRRNGRLRHAAIAGCLTLCGLLAALGLSRRAGAWDAQARDAAQRTSLITGMIDPDATLADLPYLADEAVQQSASLNGLASLAPVAPTLAEMLEAWPAGSSPSSVAIDGESILATALVTGDPGEFLAALRPPPGWRLLEPRLGSLGEATQITVSMERLP